MPDPDETQRFNSLLDAMLTTPVPAAFATLRHPRAKSFRAHPFPAAL